VLVNVMLEISRQGGIICVLHLRRTVSRSHAPCHALRESVIRCVKAVLGVSQVFRSYYLRAPKFAFFEET
jgi:hypothetical protein